MKPLARFSLGLAGLSLAVVCVAYAADPAIETKKAKPVDYTTQIKPLLAEHCYECHSAKKHESGLRLDSARGAMAGGDSGPAVVPGKSKQSLLYQALIGADDASQMPLDRPALKKEQIALFKRWIDEGASAPQDEVAAGDLADNNHWAFQPIVPFEPPVVKNTAWPQNRIDFFVLWRLEKDGSSPSSPADPTTLIRRLSLDLRGLLPSIEDVDQFLVDAQPGAYERLVDRMLATPQYGERWGRHWLDAARYADSNGFTIDGPRSIWSYRDWVIDAVNSGMPFDQFTIEQVAGDLLPDAARDQLVATGFHRNTLINQEGGTDPEQFRVESVVDRVNTTGSVFLGLTIGCARCHEHKFDPISQRDYYQLFAFFNHTEDVKSIQPVIPLPTPRQAARQTELKSEIAAVTKTLKAHDAAIADGQADWEKKVASIAVAEWVTLDPSQFISEAGATIDKFNDKSPIAGGNGNIPANDTYVVTADVLLDRIAAVRLEVLTNSNLPKNGPGLADNGNFVLSEFEASAAPLQGDGAKSRPVHFGRTTGDWSQEGYPIEHAVDGNLQTGWAISVGKGQGSANVDREAIFIIEKPIEQPGGSRLTFRFQQKHGSPKFLVGRFRLSVCSDTGGEEMIPVSIKEVLRLPAEKRTDGHKAVLKAAYNRTDTTRKPLEQKLNALLREERALTQAIPTTMVMRERKPPREMYVMVRGDFLRKGAPVEPKIPAVLPQLPHTIEHPNRLDFARWLVSDDNPLTPRVTVNRYWQRFFGIGLVQTENDFGTRGTPPTHPQLLDWLASEFVRSGWDVKRLHRLIVTSATYRQSSHVTADRLSRDPGNRLLGRQSRIRLEAEAIRDVCLAASGLLSQKIGGPGVYPPQPTGINLLTQVSKIWPESKGTDRFRRGMYVYFWRSNPYPFLATFDAPQATTTCTRRVRSNTPLQALTLANDLAFFEIAQGLASRVLAEGPDYDGGRIRYLFRVCLSREPNEQELNRLTQFVQQQRKHFQQSTKEAHAVAASDRPQNVSEAESASWTAVARVFLNLDEFITRE